MWQDMIGRSDLMGLGQGASPTVAPSQNSNITGNVGYSANLGGNLSLMTLMLAIGGLIVLNWLMHNWLS